MRLTAEFWVSAYRARLEAMGIAVYVAARGDPTAGAILIKLATLDGQACLFGRVARVEGGQGWDVIARGTEADVDAAAARQRRYDADLWLIEVEDRQGRHLLDDSGFSG